MTSHLEGAVTMDSTLSVAGNATFSSDISAVNGTFSGNVSAVDVSGSGALSITGNATIGGDISAAAADFSSLHVTGNAQIDGDLKVKGSMTYIDTVNMRVQDAFIYLATGSAGSSDSGIVLHDGAGAAMDLVIGQAGGAGEVIFGKGDRHPDGDGTMAGIDLVPAWMSEAKIGAAEGAAVGSMYKSGSALEIAANDELLLKAGAEEFSLAAAGDQAAFEAQFGAVSIISALVSAASGGNFKQDALMPGTTVAGDDINFSAIGSLRNEEIASDAAKKVAMDVYLNGVRLAFGDDYSIQAVDKIRLTVDTMVDDRLFIVLHNAA